MHIFKNNNYFNIDYINHDNKPLMNNNKSPKSIQQSINSFHQSPSSNNSLNYQNSIHQQTKQNKDLTKPNQVNNNFLSKKINAGQNIQQNIDYGIFNQYRLDEFFDIQKNLDQGSVLPIVSIGSHALHLQQKFLNFLQKYTQFQLIFVGVYGPKNSGKSLFLDKILNLATFEGSHFTQQKKPKSKKQICLWTVPISKGKQKIFLVDCTGYSLQKDQQRQNQMLCDFMMFLCSQIILIQSNDDKDNKIISQGYQMLKNSFNRMHMNKVPTSKDSFYWPMNFSLGYRKSQKPQQNPYKRLFMRYEYKKLGDIKDDRVNENMQNEQLKSILLTKYADRKKKILNQSYLQICSQYIKQIYEQNHPKYYNQIKPNGKGLATILMNLVLSINCKQKINIKSIIDKTIKQLIADGYNSSINWYNRQLQKQLKGQQPKNSEELLSIFEKGYYKTFKYFIKYLKCSLIINKTDLNSDINNMINDMQTKLQKYMRQKQLIIKKINQKKTIKYLKPIIDKKINIKQMPMKQILQLRQILYKSKTIQRKLDVNRLQCLKQKMIEGWNKFIINQDIKYKQQIIKLQTMLEQRKQQLHLIQQKNNLLKLKATQKLQKFSYLNRQSTDLLSKVQNLKFQINIHKKTNQQKLQNSYQKIHMIYKNQSQLLVQLKQYQQKLLKRHKQKTQQLKVLKQELQEAYKIENQEIKKIQQSRNTNALFSDIKKLKINATSQYLIGTDPKSNNQLSNIKEQQISFFQNDQNKEPQVPQALLSSRLAKNTQSIRLLKNIIQQKSKNQQQLKQKISSSYINLSRVNTQYKNNKIRAVQSRKINIPKSPNKLQQFKSPNSKNNYQNNPNAQILSQSLSSPNLNK